MLIFGAAPRGQNKRLKDVLTSLGLTTNLKLCLDAGDISSYTGSGKWLDTSGGGYDFDNNGATFNGTAGSQGANYFSGDGGDYFSYDSTIESWMQAIGKNGGGAFALWAVVYIASDDETPIFSTRAVAGSARGFSLTYNDANNRIIFHYPSSSDTQLSAGGAGPDISGSLPGLFVVGFSTTTGAGNGYRVHVNGTNYTGSLSGTTPGSSNPSNNMKLMALGSAEIIAPSGTRLLAGAIVQGSEWTSDNYTALWNAVRGRYGL